VATMTPTKRIWADVHIRGGEAVWVLLAHAYALLVPLAIVAAVSWNWAYLQDVTYNPFLFFAAACLLSAGGAFEAAQNTMDNWYLTEESASTNGYGFADFLFYWLITAGQACIALAIGGDQLWVVLVSVAAVVALPIFYLRQGPYFVPLSVVNLAAIVLAFNSFGDPVIFLQLLLTGATMYFFAALLRTRAQVLHGFTTLSASSGLWFLVWAISNGAAGSSVPLVVLAVIVVAAVTIGVLLWRRLLTLRPSRRAVTLAA